MQTLAQVFTPHVAETLCECECGCGCQQCSNSKESKNKKKIEENPCWREGTNQKRAAIFVRHQFCLLCNLARSSFAGRLKTCARLTIIVSLSQRNWLRECECAIVDCDGKCSAMNNTDGKTVSTAPQTRSWWNGTKCIFLRQKPQVSPRSNFMCLFVPKLTPYYLIILQCDTIKSSRSTSQRLCTKWHVLSLKICFFCCFRI